jgi:thioredoxin-like negative regulator of GroEL
MFIVVQSFEEFVKLKEEEPALLGYFSTETCNVCKVLKPKVAELIQNEFPKIKPAYIKSDVLPDVAAQNQVFAAPTILVFFEGRETIRKSRNIGIGELRREIERPYSIIFNEQ